MDGRRAAADDGDIKTHYGCWLRTCSVRSVAV
jgi:hypothetical protein